MSEEAQKVDAWMPLWIGAYMADTMTLTTQQHGAYLLLLFAYWRNRGPLEDDDEDLAAITKASPAEWRKLRVKLTRFFDVADGLWAHGRADKELAAAGLRKANAVSKAKAAAEARWKKSKKQCSKHAPSIPQALLEDCPTPSPSSTSSPTSKKNYKTPPPPKGGAVGSGFEAFWTAFPASTRKAARLQCWNKWKAKGLDAQADAIVAHVKAMASSEAWTKDGGQYIPAPLTYLNQARWEAPTEAQAAEAKQEANWRDTWQSVVKRGLALGVGDWSEALWAAGKAPDFPTYLRRVEKALAEQQPADEVPA